MGVDAGKEIGLVTIFIVAKNWLQKNSEIIFGFLAVWVATMSPVATDLILRAPGTPPPFSLPD